MRAEQYLCFNYNRIKGKDLVPENVFKPTPGG